MKKDRIYRSLVERMHEVSRVPPQDIGILTPIYHRLTLPLKFFPWKVGIVLSFLFSLILYLILGATLVRLVSLIQYGF